MEPFWIMEQREKLRDIGKKYPSVYVYHRDTILTQLDNLQQHFPRFGFLYSLKANPFPPLVKAIASQGVGADAASAREVELAAAAGMPPSQIYYSAPGKTWEDLERTLGKAVIIADSLHELELLEAVAAERSTTYEVGLRINPNFAFTGGPGVASKFGVDQDQALAYLKNRKPGRISVQGIHVHLRSQELDPKLLAAYYGHVLELAQETAKTLGRPLAFVNLGYGIGIPYNLSEKPLDLDALAKGLAPQEEAFAKAMPQTKVLIETGRYAVGQAGVYLTRVLDRKESHGKTFLILSNTLNGFIRPSLGQLVQNYSPNPEPAACEPLYSEAGAFQFFTLREKPGALETVTLVGNLCTAADVVAEDLELPRLEIGDVVGITNAGAYGRVLSPDQFASVADLHEVLL